MNFVMAIALLRKYLSYGGSGGAEFTFHHYKSERSGSKLRETFKLAISLYFAMNLPQDF